MAKVCIYMEGGIIHNIMSDIDLDVSIIDFDVDNAEQGDLTVTREGQRCYTTHMEVRRQAYMPDTFQPQDAARLMLVGIAASVNKSVQEGCVLDRHYALHIIDTVRSVSRNAGNTTLRTLIDKLIADRYLI